jgi:sugar diacid utilization regulator
MPKHVSEIKIVLRITATYFSNQLKMESLNQESATTETEEKLKKLTQAKQKTEARLADEIEKFKLKLPKHPRVILITFQSKEEKKITKILNVENPKVDLKYCEIGQTKLFTYIKTGLAQGDFTQVTIEVLR